MRKQISIAKLTCLAMLVAGLATLGIASSASAHTGEWAAFNNCPSTNAEVNKCLHSVTNGGKVVLGKKTVPIVNPVTLEGGVTAENEEEETPEYGFSRMVTAANGVTLSKTPEPVPGGLSGLVNCKEISSWLVRVSCEGFFENGLTGVNATLELAKPASEIRISQEHLVFEEGIGLELPVKVHLENPFLGSSCYIGSSSSPLMWKLTTGTTEPPEGVEPLTGEGGLLTFTEKGQILHITGAEHVDNTWSAPKASGCGGFLIEYLINPIINAQIGLPTAAGQNQAVLGSINIDLARAAEVNKH